MKTLIFIILFAAILLLAGFYVVLETPLAVNALFPRVINDMSKDFQIIDFKCKSQRSQLPDFLEMQDVAMKVVQGDRVFDLQARKLSIHNFWEFIKDQELAHLSSEGFYLTTRNVDVRGGQFKIVVGLKDWRVVFAEGAGFGQEIRVGEYKFVQTTGHMRMNSKKMEIFDIKGSFYDGTFTGQLVFDFKPQFSYLVWVEFNGVPSRSVAAPYPEFFSAMQGDLSGSVRVVGGQRVDIFSVNLKGSSGMSISPKAFLKMKGAFAEEEVAALQKLADSGAALMADRASLLIQNSRDSVMLVFDIKEAKEGLILKGNFPFEWPQGFESFLFPIPKP